MSNRLPHRSEHNGGNKPTTKAGPLSDESVVQCLLGVLTIGVVDNVAGYRTVSGPRRHCRHHCLFRVLPVVVLVVEPVVVMMIVVVATAFLYVLLVLCRCQCLAVIVTVVVAVKVQDFRVVALIRRFGRMKRS